MICEECFEEKEDQHYPNACDDCMRKMLDELWDTTIAIQFKEVMEGLRTLH